MPDQYSKHITARFERAYDKEDGYSVKEYDVVHAKQYFMKVQEHINNLAQSPLVHEPRGKNVEYRISNVNRYPRVNPWFYVATPRFAHYNSSRN